jgi:hypothetical protein
VLSGIGPPCSRTLDGVLYHREMSENLTDQDRADLAQFLRDAIAADFFPRSKRMRRWKELLAKLDASVGAGPETVLAP